MGLDESLAWAFGIIKFMVIIITKLARYGIKNYVVTDAEILYSSTTNAEYKEMIRVEKYFCETFTCTYHTI